jgi:uncharacterized protein
MQMEDPLPAVNPQGGIDARAVILRLAAECPETFFLDAFGRPARPASPPGGAAPEWPHSFTLRLSGRCNLACDYCFDAASAAPRGAMDAAAARRVAAYILRAPVTEPLIAFLGGEPLLNWPVGRQLVEQIRREGRAMGKSPYFSLTTNGTLITDDLAPELVGDDITVQVSLDGSRQHDRHRRYPDGTGSYRHALAGLRRLRAVSPAARVDAQVVLSPGSPGLGEIADELRGAGFRRIGFLYLTDPGGHSAWSGEDVRWLMRQRQDFYPRFVQATLEGHPEIDMGFAFLVASQPEGPRGLCGCGRQEVYIDARGDIYSCPRLYGQPGVGPLGRCDEASAGAPPSAGARPAVRDPGCAECWAAEWCGGGCAFQCQRCALLPAAPTSPTQALWCDLLRAQLARAALTYHVLRRFHPEALGRLRALFGRSAA